MGFEPITYWTPISNAYRTLQCVRLAQPACTGRLQLPIYCDKPPVRHDDRCSSDSELFGMSTIGALLHLRLLSPPAMITCWCYMSISFLQRSLSVCNAARFELTSPGWHQGSIQLNYTLTPPCREMTPAAHERSLVFWLLQCLLTRIKIEQAKFCGMSRTRTYEDRSRGIYSPL